MNTKDSGKRLIIKFVIPTFGSLVIVLQKVRKQGWHERKLKILTRDNYKSLIPTFSKHTIMITNKP